MENNIIEKLQNVINALNHVSCEGMNNLLNLGGSINLLGEIMQDIQSLLENEKET